MRIGVARATRISFPKHGKTSPRVLTDRSTSLAPATRVGLPQRERHHRTTSETAKEHAANRWRKPPMKSRSAPDRRLFEKTCNRLAVDVSTDPVVSCENNPSND